MISFGLEQFKAKKWIRKYVGLNLLDINNKSAILLFVGAAILTSFTMIINQSAHAVTGNGKDVFKVIVTVFGADKSKGDVVSIVTVNGGEDQESSSSTLIRHRALMREVLLNTL
jgi:hypothetical protein